MDIIFFDRLTAKIRQNLRKRGHPDTKYGLGVFVHQHLKQNGDLVEEALAMLRRYWERARPLAITTEGAAHERLLLELLNKDRKLLSDLTEEFTTKHPRFASENPSDDIESHFEIYESKVRDEIAFLKSIRRHEVIERVISLFVGAVIPVGCVILAAFLASDARSTLKEVTDVRQEMAELARSSLVASSLILDGADRLSAPTHKVAALKRMKEVEVRLAPYYPTIHDEIKSAVKQANLEEDKFWKKYESLPQEKQEKFMKDYIESVK